MCTSKEMPYHIGLHVKLYPSNEQKQRTKVAFINRKIARRRDDYLNRVSRHLIEKPPQYTIQIWPACGKYHLQDMNAAQNILNKALTKRMAA